jgi:hypothetical protein
VDDIWLRYYGTYRGMTVIQPLAYFMDGWLGLPISEYVAGYRFSFHRIEPILVWRNGVFYSLSYSYMTNLLSARNIQSIHSLWQERRHPPRYSPSSSAKLSKGISYVL